MNALQLIEAMWSIPYLTRWDEAKSAAIVAAKFAGNTAIQTEIQNMPKHFKVSFLPNITTDVKYFIDGVQVKQKNNLVLAGKKVNLKVTKPGYTANERNVTINANGVYSFLLVKEVVVDPPEPIYYKVGVKLVGADTYKVKWNGQYVDSKTLHLKEGVKARIEVEAEGYTIQPDFI